jgi:tRNA-Thr(GGU) m(6)t(6)A37 methyltransferase TsaA
MALPFKIPLDTLQMDSGPQRCLSLLAFLKGLLMESINYRSIGTIETPYASREGMPIQAAGARGVRGRILLQPEYMPGLQDLAGFSHLILLYHFHLTRDTRLVVTPFLDTTPRGVFATRSPNHPNPIGISIVRLLEIKAAVLEIEDVDMVNGTPLLDIKPYVPAFDHRQPERLGWLEEAGAKVGQTRADRRFR